MTSTDVSRIIMGGNDIAMQWYALTHNVAAIPGSAGSVVIGGTPGGGVSASFGPGTLLIVGVALVAAILIFRK